MATKRYRPGQAIIQEGTAGTSAYIMRSGKVEVTKLIGNKEITLATFGAGEIFGEMALLGAQHRTATIRAIEMTELVVVSRARLLMMFKTCDPILKHLCLTLINRLKRTNELIKPDKTDKITRSVCRILVLLANHPTATRCKSDAAIQISSRIMTEEVSKILTLDLADLKVIFDRLEMMNLIEIEQTRGDRLITIPKIETFVDRIERIADEIDEHLQDRIKQRSGNMNILELTEDLKVDEKKILGKIGDGDMPPELFLFPRDDFYEWLSKVGVAFFEAQKKKVITSENLSDLEDLIGIKNAVLKQVFGKVSVYNLIMLSKHTESDPELNKKIASNIPPRVKRTVDEELPNIESIDEDELEEAIDDLIETIKDTLREAEQGKSQSD